MPTVKTPEYKVEIDKEFSALKKYILSLNPSRTFVIVDENTKEHCLPLFHESVNVAYETLEIKSGEVNKNLTTATLLWNQLIEKGCDRSSLVINLGGGVIGDMGGFVASTYMRGIRFIQMPTTLLSQVDASIGGKLGIDHQGYKNMIGTFQNPALVWIHTPFLETLDKREILSGFAEVIKHALISSKPMWEKIKNLDGNNLGGNWSDLVARSVKIKNAIVTEDPKEGGLRKVLNFGHTIGHAIESLFLGTERHLLHGEAIAKGMICEGYMAFKSKRISIIEMEEMNTLLESLYDLPTIQSTQIEDIISLVKKDKKNTDGQVNFSLLSGIGSCDYDVQVPTPLIRESLTF